MTTSFRAERGRPVKQRTDEDRDLGIEFQAKTRLIFGTAIC